MKIKVRKEYGLLILSLFFVAILYILVWKQNGIHLAGNDDYTLMASMAGFNTGVPEAKSLYSGFLWGKIVSGLYQWNAAVAWYPLVFCILIYISLVCICYSILCIFSEKWEWLWGTAIFLILYFGIFWNVTIELQFTTVAAICGSAVIANIITHKRIVSRVGKLCNIFVSGVLFLMAYNIRVEVGYLLISCMILILLIEVAAKGLNRKNAAGFLLCFFAMLLISVVSEHLTDVKYGWMDYRQFRVALSQFIDYSHPDFDEYQSEYEEIGWSKEVYQMAEKWCFLDETINYDNLVKINGLAPQREKIEIKEVIGTLSASGRVNFQMIIWLFFVVMYCIVEKDRKNVFMRGIFLFMAFGGEMLLLAVRGRLPYRVSESLVILFCVAGILEMLQSKKAAEKQVYIMIVVGMAGTCLMNKVETSAYVNNTSLKALEVYAMKNKDNLYIHNSVWSGESFTVYPDEKPSNLMFWGGGEKYSPLYYDQLHINGLDELNTEELFASNVYYIDTNMHNEYFFEYMTWKYPECTYQVVEEEPGFVVYKFDN